MSIQLKPSAVKVDAKIRLPTTVSEEDEDDFEDIGEDESTSWSAVGSDVEEDEEDGSSSSYFETETETDESDET